MGPAVDENAEDLASLSATVSRCPGAVVIDASMVTAPCSDGTMVWTSLRVDFTFNGKPGGCVEMERFIDGLVRPADESEHGLRALSALHMDQLDAEGKSDHALMQMLYLWKRTNIAERYRAWAVCECVPDTRVFQ